MASLRRSATGVFHLDFRYQDAKLHRSLETNDEAEARHLKAIVERTLKHLREGVLTLPKEVTGHQLWQFVRSGGKVRQLPQVVASARLGDVADEYLGSFAEGTKEGTTLNTETHHVSHFRRFFGNGMSLDSIGPRQLDEYVSRRLGERGIRGGTIKPVTVQKELQTFRQLWEFARSRGYALGESPTQQIKKPRRNQKARFQSWEEIEARVQRGGLTEVEVAECWDCLFLREYEVAEFLQHVKAASACLPRFPYIHGALAFCAYTGARRSEMFRCLMDDVKTSVLLREKKRQQDRRITFREVPLHPQLAEILDEWTAVHPGGQYLFCKNNRQQLDDKTSREAFAAVTQSGKWAVLRGYHVLRHSFASNLARHGVDQYKIDEFMGHQTEEMRCRYRHLFPEDRKSAIAVLDYASSARGSKPV